MPATPAPVAMPAPALRLDAVTFAYEREPVVVDCSIAVAPGEVVALVGSSGAGKSTLLSLANGTLEPDEGTVAVEGTVLASVAGRRRRATLARVGTVAQQVPLPGNLRVIHNVNSGRLGAWGLARSVRSLLAPVAVDEARAALERLGIAHLLDARTDGLSGGQQQRVAVARALVARPALVLADEPVSAVDPSWSTEVVTALCELADEAGTGVLVSLHDPVLARRHAHRVVAVGDGRIVWDRPSEEVTPADLGDVYDLASAPTT